MAVINPNVGTIHQQFAQWKAHLESYRGKLGELKLKAEKLEQEAKLEYLQKLKELENKIVTAQEKLEEQEIKYENLKEVSEEAWAEFKSGGQMAWDELKTGIEGAWEEMKGGVESASSTLSKRKK